MQAAKGRALAPPAGPPERPPPPLRHPETRPPVSKLARPPGCSGGPPALRARPRPRSSCCWNGRSKRVARRRGLAQPFAQKRSTCPSRTA
eukprot:2528067-Prymnesium_polylepis.1